MNFTQMCKEDNNLIKTSPENLKKKILSNSFYETSFTQIKNQTETIQTRNYRLIFFIYIDAKEFLTKFEQFESESKLQVGLLLLCVFFQECKVCFTSKNIFNVIHHTNKLKRKTISSPLVQKCLIHIIPD